MKRILTLVIVMNLYFFLTNCSDNSAKGSKTVDPNSSSSHKLTKELAMTIFDLPTHCLEIEYPNKLGQVLASDADLKSPKQLRPIFYGCFDWHSSVHGYWSIIELLRQFPDLDNDQHIRSLLNHHLTPENVAIEMAFFNDVNNSNFERTYGWAWLFKLQESLHKWNDSEAQLWKQSLQPLVDLLVAKYKDYLPKLVYPIRTGQHDNSAFGLSLSLDYARTVNDTMFEKIIVEHAKRLFETDTNCPLEYEPSGYDFLSPCLEEAYLMSKILESGAYETWLKDFMPSLYEHTFVLEPAVVNDRTDGKLVHLDGLNYSRAACLYGIARDYGSSFDHLRKIADKHIAFSLPNLSTQDDYMGSHWLGTFALYALSHVQ